MKTSLSVIFSLVFALLIICILEVSAQQVMPAFSNVERIFQTQCLSCHSGTIRPAAGLHMGSYSKVMAGSKSGPVIVKGDPAKSELLKRIKGISTPRMPKGGPPWLSEKETTLIETWIAAGAAE